MCPHPVYKVPYLVLHIVRSHNIKSEIENCSSVTETPKDFKSVAVTVNSALLLINSTYQFQMMYQNKTSLILLQLHWFE